MQEFMNRQHQPSLQPETTFENHPRESQSATQFTEQQFNEFYKLLAYREAERLVPRARSIKIPELDTPESTYSQETILRIANEISQDPQLVKKTLDDYLNGQLSGTERSLIPTYNTKNSLFADVYRDNLDKLVTSETRNIGKVSYQVTLRSTLPDRLTRMLENKGYVIYRAYCPPSFEIYKKRFNDEGEELPAKNIAELIIFNPKTHWRLDVNTEEFAQELAEALDEISEQTPEGKNADISMLIKKSPPRLEHPDAYKKRVSQTPSQHRNETAFFVKVGKLFRTLFS